MIDPKAFFREHPTQGLLFAFALIAGVIGLAVAFMRGMNKLAQLLENRRPLTQSEKAVLALAAHYAALNEMNDADLSGLPARFRQNVWRQLAKDWRIEGLLSKKKVLARQALDWLLERGHRGDPRVATPERAEALLAFDMSRVVHVARLCHFAGYIDDAHAWRCIRAAAEHVRGHFGDWETYSRALLEGRALVLGKADPRFSEVVSALLAQPESPWRRFTWAEAVAS
jgi:hypothetical protein